MLAILYRLAGHFIHFVEPMMLAIRPAFRHAADGAARTIGRAGQVLRRIIAFANPQI